MACATVVVTRQLLMTGVAWLGPQRPGVLSGRVGHSGVQHVWRAGAIAALVVVTGQVVSGIPLSSVDDSCISQRVLPAGVGGQVGAQHDVLAALATHEASERTQAEQVQQCVTARAHGMV